MGMKIVGRFPGAATPARPLQGLHRGRIKVGNVQNRWLKIGASLHPHINPVRSERPAPNDERQAYQLNALRHGHALIGLLRIFSLPKLDARTRTTLGEAIESVRQSTISGQFGDAKHHLQDASQECPPDIRGELRAVGMRLSSSVEPISPGNHPVEQIGAQAMAGTICARLLGNVQRPELQPFQPVPALRSTAIVTVAEALTRELATCESKDQVIAVLSGFVDRFRLGEVPLPAGRFTVLDEARSALVYCETFDVRQVGQSLSAPTSGFPLLEAKALNEADRGGWRAALMA